MYFIKAYENFIYKKKKKKVQLHIFRLFAMISINYILSSVLFYEHSSKSMEC